jgi:hypothetical protein
MKELDNKCTKIVNEKIQKIWVKWLHNYTVILMLKYKWHKIISTEELNGRIKLLVDTTRKRRE